MMSESSTLTDVLERLELENGNGRLQQLQVLQVRIRAVQTLHILIQQSFESLAEHSSIFLPALIDALGDANHQIREIASSALQQVLQQWTLPIALPELALAWVHRNYLVKEGAILLVTATIKANPVAITVPAQWQHLVLQPAVKLLGDPHSAVRNAAMDCIEELYEQLGQPVLDAIMTSNMKSSQLKELHARLGSLQAAPEAVQDYPLFHPATKLLSHGSTSSVKSDDSQQSTEAASSVAVASPSKPSPNRQTSARLLEHACSTDSSKRELTAALPKTVRRGGFKDPGGLSAAGALPQVAPIWVDSERELKTELDKLAKALDEKQDWTKRIEALLRLEGLLEGGAAGFDSFLDLLKLLQQPLTVQLNDRRSAVSRVACRSLISLAAALGSRFDVHALYFLPIIFKVTVFTVQVMAEAADACAHALLHYCPSAKLLKPLADVICTDKSAKLRQHCAKYMLQALESWDLESCIKSLDLVEASIRSAAQDSSSATRSHGRNMFGAYASALPQRAQAFLRRMDSSLQEKLNQALQQYVPGNIQFVVSEQQAQPSTAAWSGSLPRLPPTPPSSRHPTGRVSVHVSGPADARQAASEAAPLPATRLFSRKSVGGNALRILANATESTSTDAPKHIRSAQSVQRTSHLPSQLPPCFTPAPAQQPPPTVLQGRPQRHPAAHVATPASMKRGAGTAHPQRVASQPTPVSNSYSTSELAREAQVPGVHLAHAMQDSMSDAASECSTSGQDHMQDMMMGTPANAHQLLALAESTGMDWKARVDLFQAMQQTLKDSSIQDAASWTMHGDKVVQLMLEHISDAHSKVAHAAMEALGAALQHHPAIVEGHLDRLMPALSQRLTDAKEVLRSVATGCLQTVLRLYPLEVCLPQLARSLDAVKSAKTRIALLQLISASCGSAVTTAAALPALRMWVGKVAGLVGDRNAEVRRAACQALHLVYTCMDGPTLLAHIAQARPPDQMTLRRALSPMLHNLDAQLLPYSRSRAVQSRDQRPSTAQSNVAMPASTSAQGVDLPAHPDTEHLSQVLHSAGSGQSGSSMLGNVTSTAQLQSLRSPRLQTTGIVSDAGLDGAASILDGKSSSPGTVHQSFTDPQQQQQLLSNNKGELIYLSRQKHITVDTRGSLKQSVFRVADLPAAQPNAQEQQQRSVSAQSVLHNFPADATAVADNHIDMQQQLRVPFAEYPDPTGNCNSHSSGHHLAAAPFPQHPNYAHSPHSSQTVFDTGPMNSSGSSFSGRAAQQSLNQVPCSPGLALPGSHATVIAKPEAVQAASRAALMQTSLQAQQAEGTELCSAVNALQPLVAAAEPMQLQQCLPQVVPALLPAVQSDQWQAQEAAVAVIKVLIRQVGSAVQPWLSALLPGLVQAACCSKPQVCMAADECCSLLLLLAAPAACLALLKPNLPAAGTVNTPACPPAQLIQASVKNIGRAVQRMPSTDLLTELQSPDLLPGLFEAFDHQSADVRKAVTMCLMHMWQVMGDDLKPFLSPLRVSKIKLVTAYVEQAQGQRRMAL